MNSRRAEGFHSIRYVTAIFDEPHGLVVRNAAFGASALDFGGILEVLKKVGNLFILCDGQDDGHAIAFFIRDKLRGKWGWLHWTASVDNDNVAQPRRQRCAPERRAPPPNARLSVFHHTLIDCPPAACHTFQG